MQLFCIALLVINCCCIVAFDNKTPRKQCGAQHSNKQFYNVMLCICKKYCLMLFMIVLYFVVAVALSYFARNKSSKVFFSTINCCCNDCVSNKNNCNVFMIVFCIVKPLVL